MSIKQRKKAIWIYLYCNLFSTKTNAGGLCNLIIN